MSALANRPGGVLSQRRGLIRGIVTAAPRLGLVWILILLFAAFSIWLPHTFFTTQNVRTIVNSQAVVLILAIAATVSLRAGDFDLSIAAVMTASTATVVTLSANHYPIVVAVLAALGLAFAIGVINAVLIVLVGVDALIATLGMTTALGGYAYAVTNSNVISFNDTAILHFARSNLLSFPAATWYGWALVVIAWYVYERTPLGRYLVFVGGNRDAARLAGLRTNSIRMGALVTTAILSGFAGLVLAGQLGAIDPSIGPQYLLQPFAAALLGATTITVGRQNAVGTLVALYLLAVGVTGLELGGASAWVNNVFNGLALVAAVTITKLSSRFRVGR